MTIVIVAATLFLPPMMCMASSLRKSLRLTLDLAALLFLYIFSIMSALAVYEINRHNTVLTTEIHMLFMKPLFLIAGAYLGLYGIYRLIYGAWRRVFQVPHRGTSN